MEVVANNLVGLFRRTHKITGQLWSPAVQILVCYRIQRVRSASWQLHILTRARISRKIQRHTAARLWFSLAEINRTGIDARRSSRLKAPHRQPQRAQRIRHTQRRAFSRSATRLRLLAHYQASWARRVESQLRDPSSLLLWVKRMLDVRRRYPVFGTGAFDVLSPDNPAVLAFIRQLDEATVLCVNNLSSKAQPVELHLERFEGKTPVELLGRVQFPNIGELPYLLTLAPYGFFWFELAESEPGD